MSRVVEKDGRYSQVDASLGPAEFIVISNNPLRVPAVSVRAVIRAGMLYFTAAGTSGVTPRIRRGLAVSSPLVGEGNFETAKAPAGSVEYYYIVVSEELTNVAEVTYSFTCEIGGAAVASTLQEAFIDAELLV